MTGNAPLAVAAGTAVDTVPPFPAKVIGGHVAGLVSPTPTIGSVASSVLWSDVPGAIVGVPEIPQRAGVDTYATPCAVDETRFDLRLPLSTKALVLGSVPTH